MNDPNSLLKLLVVSTVLVLSVFLYDKLDEDNQATIIGTAMSFGVLGLFFYALHKGFDRSNDIFKNPSNNYTEEISSFAWLWVLIFGGFYFLFKGAIRHFFLYLFFSLLTVGLAWLIYPFFARDIIRNHYRRQGWIEVEQE